MQSSFAQRCFDLIEEYAPGFNSSIIGYDMLTPPDLEREIGLTGTHSIHCRNKDGYLYLHTKTIRGYYMNLEFADKHDGLF